MERQLAVLPRIAVLDKSSGNWTSLEEAILDSLMDCTYYKVTCIIVMGTQLQSPHILQTSSTD